ncbi:MAG: hypothetical protein GY862_34140, partial [Gammaproteobacteria bacterium]|nr:hypothetical protein [Gammaproteobacteria bacterium]
RDNTGFVTDAEPVTLRVEQGQAITHAHFDFASEILHLPAVTVPNALGGTDIFQADLLLRSSDPVVLELISAAPAEETASVSFANFTRGTIHIPALNIPNTLGGMDEYSINLQLVPDSSPIRSPGRHFNF